MNKSQLSEHFEKILTFQQHSIFDVEHSVARYKERISNDLTAFYSFLRNIIIWLKDNKKEDVEDRYIFISIKYGFGVQLHWRKDRFKNIFNGYTATTLSSKEMKHVLNNDKKVFIENIRKSHDISLKESKDVFDKGYTRFSCTKILNKEFELCGLDKFVEAGNIHYNHEIVII